MNPSDVAVYLVVVVLILALLTGALEAAHAIRRFIRRRRVRAELAAVSGSRPHGRAPLRAGPALVAVRDVPARNNRLGDRDPTIGVDQARAERERFLTELQARGLYVDELRIEAK